MTLKPELKHKLRILDYIAIYLLIAGTYTPVVLLKLSESNGYLLFSVVWVIALVRVILKLFYTGRYNLFSTMLYAVMGWLIVIDYRALNILTPRTFFINVDNQSNDYLALFQEKTEKEFLEFNHRKESVILEGDERYIFDVNEKDFGWESKLISLAKVSNENLLDKSPDYRDILLNSLSNLNKFYLNTKNYYEHYELFPYNVSKTDNEYLNKSDFLDHESNFGIFNSLIFATNSQHALVPHNRKFYWNKEYQTFEPIYYDGNINIHERLDKKSFPKNAKFFKHASETLNLFNKLDNKSVIQKIKKNFNVIKINDKQINLKIEKIRFNLNEIINFQEIKVTKKPLIEFDNYKTNLENYFSRLGNKKILPIFIDEQFNNFYKCNKNHCDLIKFNNVIFTSTSIKNLENRILNEKN